MAPALERGAEHLLSARVGKQCQRRAQRNGIYPTEHIDGGSADKVVEQTDANAEPAAELQVVELRTRLIDRANDILLVDLALPQAAKLREDEAHPVAPLAPAPELGERGPVGVGSRENKAVEVVGVGQRATSEAVYRASNADCFAILASLMR
jgi:hypothetical protein